jgi:selenide,water dikinase
LELARGAGVCVELDWASVPLLPGVRALAEAGMVTGASTRNWSGYGSQVRLPDGFSATDRALLTDPQTSGGLLVACAPRQVDAVLNVFRQQGFGHAAVVGRVIAAESDQARLVVRSDRRPP